MGLIARLFGKSVPSPSRDRIDRLVQYAHLVESIGTLELVRGADLELLPCSKEELKATIAHVWLSPLTSRVLRQDDLIKLYGVLNFFFGADVLALIQKARQMEAKSAAGMSLSSEEKVDVEMAVMTMQNALSAFECAKADLEREVSNLRVTLRDPN